MLGVLTAHPLLALLNSILLLTLYLYLTLYLRNRRINKLGARPPIIPSYLPFGIDNVIRSISNANRGNDLGWWEWLFLHCPPQTSRHAPSNKTVEMTLARQRYILTADPENIKAILATQFGDFGKGESFHRDWKPFLGDGIFNTDGEMWQRNRALIRPQFVKERVADLGIFEKHVGRLIQKMGGRGEKVDVAALFYRFTLDSATDYLLGQSVHSLESPETDFASAFAEVQRVQSLIARSGGFHSIIPRGRYWAALKVIDNFVEPFVERALRLNRRQLEEKGGESFLDALAATGTRDRKVIRDQVVNILLAGRDTTAGALSFTFLELSRHPEVWQRLRSDILELVGDTQAPTYEDLKSMPFLQHVMHETLRLYPSVPYNVRVTMCDTTLPTGGGEDGLQPIGVLKGTQIGYSALYMQRREDLYPPESAEFAHALAYAPERWEKWTPKAWTYIPFNGGPRICIGQQFALVEMAYTIVRILQRFESIERYWEENDFKFRSDVVITPANGVKVGFYTAKSG